MLKWEKRLKWKRYRLTTSRKNLIGKWQVKVYEDDQPMDDRLFTVIDGMGFSRTQAMEEAVLAQQR